MQNHIVSLGSLKNSLKLGLVIGAIGSVIIISFAVFVVAQLLF